MKFSLTSLFGTNQHTSPEERYRDLNRRHAASIRTQSAQDILAESRRIAPILSDLMASVGNKLQAGVTKSSIHQIILEEISRQNFAPAMLGYNGFPAAAAISGNDELIHGIPDETPIKDRSLITIETSIASNRAYASQGWTFPVGDIFIQQQELLSVGKAALVAAINEVRAGACAGDIGAAIQSTVESKGFQIVREYCGYAMGRDRILPDLQLLGYGSRGTGPRLVKDQILHLHVLAKAGNRKIVQNTNGWTVYAKDRCPCVALTAMVAVDEQCGTLLNHLID